MKKFSIEFQNITTKAYVPVIKRKVEVKATDKLAAVNAFNKSFKNRTGKKYEILGVTEIVEEKEEEVSVDEKTN